MIVTGTKGMRGGTEKDKGEKEFVEGARRDCVETETGGKIERKTKERGIKVCVGGCTSVCVHVYKGNVKEGGPRAVEPSPQVTHTPQTLSRYV